MSLRVVRSTRLPVSMAMRRFPVKGRCLAPSYAVMNVAGVPKIQPPMAFRCFDKPTATFLDIEEATERILTVVRNFEQVDPSKLSPTAKFSDLGLDSLDQVEVVMALEEEFVVEIADSEAERIQTVEDAVNFIVAHPRAV